MGYTYDQLNRLIGKTGSDGSVNDSYVYDANGGTGNGIGHQSYATNNANAANLYSYDAMGRVITEQYWTPQLPNFTTVISANYDLTGALSSFTYPDGQKISQKYDGSGRFAAAQCRSCNAIPVDYYFLNAGFYDPAGHLVAAQMGNGTNISASYNNRQAIKSLGYNYAGSTFWSKTFTWTANGNLLTAQDVVVGDTQQYGYDSLDRLVSAQDLLGGVQIPNGILGTYTYDSFGNMKKTQSGGYTFNPPGFTAANQVIGVGYDTAGNVVNDGLGNTYTWNAEEMIASSGSTTYSYYPDGQRASKSGSGSTDTIYFAGRPVARYSAGSWTDLVYGAGGVIAELVGSQNGAPTYRLMDHLGSGVGTVSSSGVLFNVQEYGPWGELWNSNNGNDPFKFTGKERDSESGNDYFEARYFGSSMGRFLSPDPLGGDLTNPQSLNRYSYVLNNPLTNTDPTGLYTCTDSKDCSSKKDQALEKTLAGLRNSKNADVARGANAYGAANSDNGVSVGFKDLSGSGKGGDTVSTVGTDADGNLRANSAITINSKDSGTDFTADVGHEGSHAADAQDVVKSGLENGDKTIHAGMNITPYQSEQRAYGVTNAILNSANESRNYSCGSGGCLLGRGASDIPGTVDRLLGSNPMYNQGGRPMSSTNQGPSVVNGVTPKATVPSVPH